MTDDVHTVHFREVYDAQSRLDSIIETARAECQKVVNSAHEEYCATVLASRNKLHEHMLAVQHFVQFGFAAPEQSDKHTETAATVEDTLASVDAAVAALQTDSTLLPFPAITRPREESVA